MIGELRGTEKFGEFVTEIGMCGLNFCDCDLIDLRYSKEIQPLNPSNGSFTFLPYTHSVLKSDLLFHLSLFANVNIEVALIMKCCLLIVSCGINDIGKSSVPQFF